MKQTNRLLWAILMITFIWTGTATGQISERARTEPIVVPKTEDTEEGKKKEVERYLRYQRRITPEELTAAMDASYDLKESVLRALKSNPQIQAAKAQLRGAEEGRRKSLADFGPVGTASYGVTLVDRDQVLGRSSNSEGIVSYPRMAKQHQWSLTINVDQPLFTGFRLLSTYQRAALSKELAEQTMRQTELDLINTVQGTFLTLLKARADIISAKDAVERLKSQLQTTKAYYEVGLKPRFDLLQAEADLSKAESDLLLAQNTEETQIASLNSLLALPVENPTNYVGELTYDPFDMSLNQAIDEAFRSRPELSIAQKSIEIAAKDAKISLSPIYPQVSANFQYSRTGDYMNVSGDHYTRPKPQSWEKWRLGVFADWRAWDWGSTIFGYRQARENVRKLEAEYRRAMLDTSYEVKSLHLMIQNAAKRIIEARVGVDAAREGYRMAAARYQAQVGTNTEVLDAQARVSEAESYLSQALTDYQTAISNLYRAIGVVNIELMPKGSTTPLPSIPNEEPNGEKEPIS